MGFRVGGKHMSLFDGMLRSFLQENDPDQDIEEQRLARVRQQIMQQTRVLPQISPVPQRRERRRFQWAYLFNPRRYWPNLELMPSMKLAVGCGMLILGLWVGRMMNSEQTHLVAQNTADQKISVMAMTTPWEGWIEGGE